MRQTPHGFDVLCEDVEATADDSLDVAERPAATTAVSQGR